MPQTPLMHEQVPRPPKVVQGGGIPPLAIKVTIRKAGELRDDIEQAMKEGPEHQEPNDKGGESEVDPKAQDGGRAAMVPDGEAKVHDQEILQSKDDKYLEGIPSDIVEADVT